jgi:putative tryptophan/tyrosine transport system substrate-binding protein
MAWRVRRRHRRPISDPVPFPRIPQGQNVAGEYRWAEGNNDRLPALAADLVRRRVAVIVAPANSAAALAAKAATQTIPVLFMVGSDPVERGLVTSFRHPGGNVTGIAGLSSAVAVKRLAPLHEMVPAAASIAMFVNPANDYYAEIDTREVPAAARALAVRVLIVNTGAEGDLPAAFASLAEQRIGALLIGSDAFFWAARDQVISLAARYAIPTLYLESKAVISGGLSSYGPDLVDEYRQLGVYTGRVLRGEKPADLPVIQPTKFELTLNMRTAKALGLTIPPNLLAIADEVIKTAGVHRGARKRGGLAVGLNGIEPKDELEGMMAAQLIAAHNAAMECYRRAMIDKQNPEARRENLAHAGKLSRTFATLLEALNRHRGKASRR